MRWLVGVLLLLFVVLFFVLALAARGSADHYPAEVGYLNGTVPVHELDCGALDPSLGDATCRVLADVRAEVNYLVVLYKGKVLRVWEYKDRFAQATLIFKAP